MNFKLDSSRVTFQENTVVCKLLIFETYGQQHDITIWNDQTAGPKEINTGKWYKVQRAHSVKICTAASSIHMSFSR